MAGNQAMTALTLYPPERAAATQIPLYQLERDLDLLFKKIENLKAEQDPKALGLAWKITESARSSSDPLEIHPKIAHIQNIETFTKHLLTGDYLNYLDQTKPLDLIERIQFYNAQKTLLKKIITHAEQEKHRLTAPRGWRFFSPWHSNKQAIIMLATAFSAGIILSLFQRKDMNIKNNNLTQISDFIRTYFIQGGARLFYHSSVDALINYGIKCHKDPEGIHQAARTADKSYQLLSDHIMEIKTQAWLEAHLYPLPAKFLLGFFKTLQVKKLIVQNIGGAVAITIFDPYIDSKAGQVDFKCFLFMSIWMMIVLEPRLFQAALGKILTWSWKAGASLSNLLSHYAYPIFCRPILGCFNTASHQILEICCKKKMIARTVMPSGTPALTIKTALLKNPYLLIDYGSQRTPSSA